MPRVPPPMQLTEANAEAGDTNSNEGNLPNDAAATIHGLGNSLGMNPFKRRLEFDTAISANRRRWSHIFPASALATTADAWEAAAIVGPEVAARMAMAKGHNVLLDQAIDGDSRALETLANAGSARVANPERLLGNFRPNWMSLR